MHYAFIGTIIVIIWHIFILYIAVFYVDSEYLTLHAHFNLFPCFIYCLIQVNIQKH